MEVKASCYWLWVVASLLVITELQSIFERKLKFILFHNTWNRLRRCIVEQKIWCLGNYSGEIWKRRLISTRVRPAVHTNQSRQQSFSETSFYTGGIWKRRLCVFIRTKDIQDNHAILLKYKPTMTGDYCVLKFFRLSVDWTHLMHCQSEDSSVSNSFVVSVWRGSAAVLITSCRPLAYATALYTVAFKCSIGLG